MRKAAGGWLARATNYYRRRSIQFMISLSFSIAAMAGMLFLGFALYLRFAASTEAMVRDDACIGRDVLPCDQKRRPR